MITCLGLGASSERAEMGRSGGACRRAYACPAPAPPCTCCQPSSHRPAAEVARSIQRSDGACHKQPGAAQAARNHLWNRVLFGPLQKGFGPAAGSSPCEWPCWAARALLACCSRTHPGSLPSFELLAF